MRKLYVVALQSLLTVTAYSMDVYTLTKEITKENIDGKSFIKEKFFRQFRYCVPGSFRGAYIDVMKTTSEEADFCAWLGSYGRLVYKSDGHYEKEHIDVYEEQKAQELWLELEDLYKKQEKTPTIS